MAQVTLWSRDHDPRVPGDLREGGQVAVTYSTAAIPPRSVSLPLDSYRQATPGEVSANPRLRFYPIDAAAASVELKAIREDMDKVAASAPPTLEVP